MEQPRATDGIDAVAIDGRRRAWTIAIVVLVKSRIAETPLLFAGQPVVADQCFILSHLKKGVDNAIGDRDRGITFPRRLFPKLRRAVLGPSGANVVACDAVTRRPAPCRPIAKMRASFVQGLLSQLLDAAVIAFGAFLRCRLQERQ